MRLLRGHESEILSLAYTPDGSSLVCAADDGTVRVWDLAAGSERYTLRGDRSLGGCVAVSHDGALLATGGAQSIAFWEAADGRRVASLFEEHFALPCAHGGWVNALAFVPCPVGRQLVSVGDDGLVKVWDVHTGRRRATLTGHRGEVLSVACAGGGRIFATGGSDGTVKVWEWETGRVRINRKLRAPVWALALSYVGGLFAVASGPIVRLSELLGTEHIQRLPVEGADVTCVDFTLDGKTLAAGCDDGSVRFFDVRSGRETAAFGWGLGRMNAVAFAPDGMTVAAGGSSPDVVVWDV